MPPGRIILLNGTSSAGKSTLASALREELSEPFCYFSSDQLADGGFRTEKYEIRDLGTPSERDRFLDGFHRAIVAFADAGNDLIVEHIVEERRWADQLESLFARRDVFWVGVHAPLSVLEQREVTRGDRTIGEASYHLKTHEYCRYDVEVDTTKAQAEVIAEIVRAWRGRTI
ncbi:AAA family ATPase [Rhizobium ruizarguesonis]|nr:AAA family ATPase [Rhizobium ruizarguesonis]